MRILMVCLGNICRSPIAEGVMQHKIQKHGLDWTVASAGTNRYHTGDCPHPLSQKVCNLHGIDISAQQARTFTEYDFKEYDRIYAMAQDVYIEIKRIGGKRADMSKVDYFLNELHPGQNLSVPDPYFGAEDGYHRVYEMIEATCEAIIKKYIKPTAYLFSQQNLNQ